MTNILFTCPHCSHIMNLPDSFIGKKGTCSKCKEIVEIVADAVADTVGDIVEDTVGDKTNDDTPVVQVDETEAKLREQLVDLQAGRDHYAELLDKITQCLDKVSNTTDLRSNFYQPLGRAVFTAHLQEELSEIPFLYPLLGAHHQIQQFETELQHKKDHAITGVWAKIKMKVSSFLLGRKIKRLHSSIPSLESNVGKHIIENNSRDLVKCESTNAVFEEISDWEANLDQETSEVELAESALSEYGSELSKTIPLPNIEGLITLDHAISICQQSLTDLYSQLDANTSADHVAQHLKNPLRPKFAFICPACKNRMELPAHLLNKQGKCPQCDRVVTLVGEILPGTTSPSVSSTASTSNLSPSIASKTQQMAPVAPSGNNFGLTKGSTSPNWFRLLCYIWPLILFYGMPINCRIKLGSGQSVDAAIEKITKAFLKAGFQKRKFGASLLKGNTLKCPRAIFAVRDIRIKSDRNGIVVIGYKKDIGPLLTAARLM